MKKIFAAIAALALTGQMAIGQGVSDMEVIPVSVTLNTVLRINVVKGGNIEFVINTIDDFRNGIANVDKFDTYFNVAASRDFDVNMVIEDATFIGTDNVANTMPLRNVAFLTTSDGTHVDGTNWDINNVLEVLCTGSNPIVEGIAGASAGDITENAWIINWECNTAAIQVINKAAPVAPNLLAAMVPNADGDVGFLQQSLENDRYTTNVYLELEEL